MKTLVFDIDGTLTNSKGEMSTNMVRFFEEYTKTNRVYLATGKSLAETKMFAKKAKIARGVLVCNGGANAYDIETKEMIAANFVDFADKRYICHLAAAGSMAVLAFSEGPLLGYSFGQKLREVAAETFANAPVFYEDYYAYVSRVEKAHVYNFWMMANYLQRDYKEMVQSVAAAINKRGSIYAVTTKNSNIIVFNKETTKLACLTKAFAKYHVLPADAIYFGDGIIDAECIQKLGWGIAVGNAEESVKQVANEVIGSSDDDGVYKWLMANREKWSGSTGKLKQGPSK